MIVALHPLQLCFECGSAFLSTDQQDFMRRIDIRIQPACKDAPAKPDDQIDPGHLQHRCDMHQKLPPADQRQLNIRRHIYEQDGKYLR